MFRSNEKAVSNRNSPSRREILEAKRPRKRHCHRLGLERLEDRTLLAANFGQVPQALDTILTDLNSAVNQQVWGAAPALPIVGSALTTGNPPAELQFLTNTIQAKLDAQFQNAVPQGYQDVQSDFQAALGAIVNSIQVDHTDSNNVKFQVTLVQFPNVPVSLTPALDLNLPKMGLTLQNPPTVNIAYGYSFQFNFGVTQSDVYLDTSPSPLLAIQINAGVGSFQTQANLGSLALNVSNGTANLYADFTFAVTGGNVYVNSTLNGNPSYFSANSTTGLNGNGTMSFGLQLATGNFPTISGNLVIGWPFNGDPNSGNAPSVTLKDVNVQADSFLTNAVAPVVQDINQAAVKPFTDVVNFLGSEIPILSSLPGLSGINLAKIIDAAYGGSSVDDFVMAFQAFSNLTNFSSSATIHLGDFGFSNYDPRTTALSAATPTLENSPSTPIQQQIDAGSDGLSQVDHIQGVSLPIFINPSSNVPNAVGTLLGQDYLHLFEYTPPSVNLSGQQYDGPFIPILGPLGVRLKGDLGLTTHLGFGYDTHGLVTNNLADGFFIHQADITVTAGVRGYADLNLGIVEAGVGGGIDATITFGLVHDVHESDVLALYQQSPFALFNVDGELDVGLDAFLKIGIGPFSVTFSVDLGHLTIFNFHFGPGGQPSTAPDLGDVNMNPSDPNFGQLSLNMGPRANLRNQGDTSDGNEAFAISHVSGSPSDPDGETLDIQAFGFFQRVHHVKSIYAEGGRGNNTITIDKGVLAPCELYAQFNPNRPLTPDEQFYLADSFQEPTGATDTFNVITDQGSGDARIFGGVGNDILQGGAGTNNIFGGQYNGSLFAHDGVQGDVLIGGSGLNSLYAGTSRHGMNGSTFRLVAGPHDGDSLYGSSAHTVFVAGTGKDSFQGGTGMNEYVWKNGDGDLNIFPENTPTNILEVTGSPNGNLFEIAPNTPSESLGLNIYDTYTPGERDVTNTIYVQGVNALQTINIAGNTGGNQYIVDDLNGLFNGRIGLNEDKKLIPDTEPNIVTVNGSPNANTVTIDAQTYADQDGNGNFVEYQVGTVGLNNYSVNVYGGSFKDSLAVNTGPGDDTIDISRTVVQTFVNTGDGNDTINVAAGAFDAPLSIDAGGGANNQLNFGVDPIRVLGGGLPSLVTLTDTELRSDNSGHPPIQYKATGGQCGGGITLTMSDGNLMGGHTVYVQSVLAGAPTTINTGADPNNYGDPGDRVIVGKPLLTLDYIAAPLTVHGVAENRNGTIVYTGSLSILDQSAAGQLYVLTPDTLIRGAAGPIRFDNLASLDLHLGNGPNNFAHVIGTTTFTTVTVYAGTSAESIFVTDNEGTLGGLVGPALTVNGQGATTLELDDNGNTAYSTWSVYSSSAQRQYLNVFGIPVVATVQYSNLGSLVLDGGIGGNEFDLSPTDQNLDFLPTVTVNGGLPSDTLIAYDQNAPGPFLGLSPISWTISGSSVSRPAYEGFFGQQSGTTTFNFSNIANLTIDYPINAFSDFALSPNLQNLDELPENLTFSSPFRFSAKRYDIVINDQTNPEHSDFLGIPEPTDWTNTQPTPDGLFNIVRQYFSIFGGTTRTIAVDANLGGVTVHGGTGDDNFLDFAPGGAAITDTVDGGGGHNRFKFDASNTYVVQSGSLSLFGASTPDIKFSNVSSLELIGNEFDVESTAASTVTTLTGSSSRNIFRMGDVSSIQGPVTVNGSGSDNVLSRLPVFQEFPINSDGGSITAAPDGSLWFGESSGMLGRITTTGTYSEYNATLVFGQPPTIDDLVAPSDGNLWFIDRNTNRVEASLGGGFVFVLYSAPAGGTIGNLVAAPSGIWFTESDSSGSNIGHIVLTQSLFQDTVTLTPIRTGEVASFITLGPDHTNLWFLESPTQPPTQYNYLAQITPQNVIGPEIPFSLPRLPLFTTSPVVTSLTAGPDGNLWATANSTRQSKVLGTITNGEIVKIATSGQVIKTIVLSGPTENSYAYQIVPGSDGNLWVVDGAIFNEISVVFPTGNLQGLLVPYQVLQPTGNPTSITTGPDGNMWFTESQPGLIGKISIPKQPARWQISGPDSGTLYNNVTFNTIQNLQGGLGADTFAFTTTTAGLSGRITGGPGQEILDYSQDSASVQIKQTGSGTLHGVQGTATNITAGFDNIDVVISQTASGVKIDDSANTMPTTWTITSVEGGHATSGLTNTISLTRQVQGQSPNTITLNNLASLELDGGSGANTFNILSTALGMSLTINGGSGGDSYVFGDATHSLTDLQGPVNLNPGAGANSLAVDASGSPIPIDLLVDVSPPLISGVSFPGLDAANKDPGQMPVHFGPEGSFAGGVRFITGLQPDNLDLTGLPANAPFSVTGTGTGTITIGGQDGLDAIHSQVSIAAPAILVADDRVDQRAADFTITDSSLLFDHPSTSPTSPSPGGLTINFPHNPGLPTTILGGSGGNRFNIESVEGGHATSLVTGGNDIVNVGNNGSVQGILDALSIVGAGATLVVDDSADPTPRMVTISPTSITGLAPATITYSGISNLTVDGGFGGNTIGVQNTAAGTNTTVNSGNGVDVVYVAGTTGPLSVNTQQSSPGPGFGGFEVVYIGAYPTGNTLDTIQGAVTVNTVARPGVDYADLEIEDSGATAAEQYTITNNTILRSGAAPIHYSVTNELDFFLGSGEDTVDVQSLSPMPLTLISGGVGNDTFNIGDSANTLNGIPYAFIIQIANPGSRVNLNDQGNSANLGYTLQPIAIHRTATLVWPTYQLLRSDWDPLGRGAQIDITGPLQNLVLNTGSGNDTFNVRGLAPYNTHVAIDGGSGVNTLQGPNIANTWQIGGAGAGNLDSLITFQSIQNLVGGTGNDTFAFNTGGSLAGSIDGGTGVNTLDYSQFTGDIVVDLLLNAASQVAGGVFNIEIVAGSKGNDILVGGASPNLLQGGSGRNLIIGGGGSDWIIGGGGDNILIAGTTAYDRNLTALETIMKEWLRTDLSFQKRISFIQGGGDKNEPYLLNASTVFDDGSPDTLTGGAGRNWFFWHKQNDVITNFKKGTDHRTPI